MSRFRFWMPVFTAAVIAILVIACKHEPFASDIPIQTGVCQPDTVYFERDVLPLVVNACAKSGCHDQGAAVSGYDLTSYSKILHDAVTAYQPSQSELYRIIESGQMPPRASMPSDQIAIIKKWIDQGAQNLACEDMTYCDTTVVMSYSNDVAPILQANCTGCHGGKNPSGSIALDTYTSVYYYAGKGSLVGSIVPEAGYGRMPKLSPRMPDCKVNRIAAWVNQGAKNN